MSDDSSSVAHTARGPLKRALYAAVVSAGYILWAIVAIFVIGSLGAWLVLLGLRQVGVSLDQIAEPVAQMTVVSLVYFLGTAALLFEPRFVRKMSLERIGELLGVVKKFHFRYVGLAVVAWGIYMVLTVIVQLLAARLLPWIDFTQEQQLGFDSLGSGFEVAIAFVVIVVAVPLIEEIVFRGYLYGGVRRHMPWWPAAVVVSIVFGAVHGQWNVAFDTFVLSMVACYLRERTGTIWAGVLVHAFKNSVAFYFLFVAPESLRNLLIAS